MITKQPLPFVSSRGEREMAADNKLLGQFDLVGIPAAPRGMPQIEVTFDIDANGIVHVSAKDKATGKEQKISIKSDGGLSEDEIDKMVKDAESNAEDDKKKKEAVEAKNHAEALIHSTEKGLKEHGEKLSEENKKNIEDAISDLKKSLEKNDLDDIKAKTETLTNASMKLGEEIYKAAQYDSQKAEESEIKEEDNPTTASKDEKVVDADYEEVKDKNKKDKK